MQPYTPKRDLKSLFLLISGNATASLRPAKIVSKHVLPLSKTGLYFHLQYKGSIDLFQQQESSGVLTAKNIM